VREGITVSFELSFGIADGKEHRLKPVPPKRKKAGKDADATNRNASRDREAQY